MLGCYISAPCWATLQLHFWNTTIRGKGERKGGEGEGGQGGTDLAREGGRGEGGKGNIEKVI